MKTVTNSRAVAMVGLLMVLVAVLLCVKLAMAQQPAPPTAIEVPRLYLPSTPPPVSGGGPAGPATASPAAYPTYEPGPMPPQSGRSMPPPMGAPPGMQRSPQTEALRTEIDALVEQESYTRQLMSEYSRLVDENERTAVVRELTDVVAKHFDIRQGVRERELRRLEAQLRALRDLHDKRAKLREEIVQERVRQLLRDLDGIGWGADELERLDAPRGAGAPRPGTPPTATIGVLIPGGPGGMGIGAPGGSGMPMPTGITVMGAPRVSPAAQSDQAAIEKSLNNLKHLALAMHNYLDVHGAFAPPVVYGPDGKTPHSWRVALLPFLDQKELYQQYKFDEPWDSENNLQLLDKMPAVFHDPNAPSGTVFPSYFQISGQAPEEKRTGWKIFDIIDGTSNTLALVEAKRNIPWTKPEDIPYTNDRLPKLGGHHSGVFLAAFYDGSAKRLALNLNDATLRAIITPNGGEPIDASAFEVPDPKRFPAVGGAPGLNILPTPSALPGRAPVPNPNVPPVNELPPQGSAAPVAPAGGAPAAPGLSAPEAGPNRS